MIVIPAVDIRDGLCVRLVRGDPAREMVYSSDPVEAAERWAAEGAERLHVVDLDGAMGRGSNLDEAFRIAKALKIPVEFGGGLRDLETVRRVLGGGVRWVVLGTAALKDPGWVRAAIREFPGRLIASLDAREGKAMVEGWLASGGVAVADAVKTLEGLGFQEVIFTDIKRDGTLEGPSLEATREVMRATRMGVYASGGVSALEDIVALKALAAEGLRGCVVGKALYAGRFTLAQAMAAAK